MVINKYKNIIIDKYSEYDEDSRLISDRGHNVEYLTTMRYIQKFLKPGAKILEIGAATGRYSIAKDYEAFLNWHFMTCERLDQQGYSSHLLYICKKK